MKTARRIITGIMATLTLLAAGSVWAGDLTPPGAPGSTMHTLEEIYQNQQALAARLSAIEEQTARTVPADMVLIPAGEFEMGDAFGPEGNDDELPVHTVAVSAFYMDATEVTKAKWDEVYAWATNNGYTFENAGMGKATNHPVHTVDWYDCVKWANARSEKEGLTACYLAEVSMGTVYRTGAIDPICDWYANGYRLPTEAEWEKAARGGAPGTRFPWTGVDTIQHARANYYSSGAYAYDTSPTPAYHPAAGTNSPLTLAVGSLAPNRYGLYDMAGNLYEWCWDRYSFFYYANSPDRDPRGPATGLSRMLRGGGWSSIPSTCRVAYRVNFSPVVEGNYIGLRLVRAAIRNE